MTWKAQQPELAAAMLLYFLKKLETPWKPMKMSEYLVVIVDRDLAISILVK